MKKGKYSPAIAVELLTGQAIGKVVPLERNTLRREKDFYMGDQVLSEKLAKDKELRGQPMSVLLYMLSKIENGNMVTVSQKKISEELDMHRVRVSEAIKKLLRKEIILKDMDSEVRGVYILNPEYFWKGEREKAIKRKKRNEQ
jgi:hypothetical protein